MALTVVPLLSKEKNMAANRCGKKAKTAKEALEEILKQSNVFLKKISKPKQESHFFFIFRDPLTGKRSSKHPYKPRFQKKNPADQSSISASDSNSAVDGKLSVHQIFSYIRKQGVTF